MKMLWRLSREAIRYRTLYVIAILSTLGLTVVNLAAPRLLSAMTGVVERGVDEAGLRRIGVLTAALAGLYLRGTWWATCAPGPMTSWSACIWATSTTSRPAT